jgi:hypothetical protein
MKCYTGISGSSAGLDHGDVGGVDVDWNHLARVVDQWQVLVNTVMNIRAP